MAKLKFSEKPYYNTDQIANALDPDDIFNCYLEPVPGTGLAVRRRPALTAFTDLLTGVQGDGIFEWEAAGLVLAVSNGRTYSLQSNGAFTDITTALLTVGVPVKFADGSRLNSDPFLYMANGKLVYSDNGGNTTAPTDVAAPLTADQVIYLNLRFLANVPGTNQFLFTDTDPAEAIITPTYWSSSDNPLTAEARGDDLLILEEIHQEIIAGGSQSLEVWQDDGVTPFSAIPQGATRAGVEAKYSIIKADNTIMGLCVIDGLRCVVKVEGRNPKIVSDAIANVLAGYSVVSDAIGQLITVGGLYMYLLQFPTEGKTWCYDIRNDTWVPWGSWNTTTGTMEQFIGQHACFVKSWNKHLIMSNVDGKIYEMSRSAYTDDGTPIKSWRRTIWEDHGIGERKQSNEVKVKIKTGATINGAAFLRWADDGEEEWSPYVELPLYPEGKRDFLIELKRMGKYHSRRYEISISDDADLCVVWVDEDVKALRF